MATDIGLSLNSKQGDNPGKTHNYKLIHCLVVERSGPAKNTQHSNAAYCNFAAAQHTFVYPVAPCDILEQGGQTRATCCALPGVGGGGGGGSSAHTWRGAALLYKF